MKQQTSIQSGTVMASGDNEVPGVDRLAVGAFDLTGLKDRIDNLSAAKVALDDFRKEQAIIQKRFTDIQDALTASNESLFVSVNTRHLSIEQIKELSVKQAGVQTEIGLLNDALQNANYDLGQFKDKESIFELEIVNAKHQIRYFIYAEKVKQASELPLLKEISALSAWIGGATDSELISKLLPEPDEEVLQSIITGFGLTNVL